MLQWWWDRPRNKFDHSRSNRLSLNLISFLLRNSWDSLLELCALFVLYHHVMPFKFLPAVTCDDVFELQLETRQMWCKIIECSRIHYSCCSDSNYFMKWTLFFCWFTTMLLYNNEMISLIRLKWLELFVRSLETHSSLRTKDRLPPQIANWWVRLHMNVSRLTPLYGKCPAKIELIALSTHLRQPSISTERKIV